VRPAAPSLRRGDSAAPAERVSAKRLRTKAWLLGALAFAFYVALYVWNLVRDVAASGGG
jgi:hypothetical protein